MTLRSPSRTNDAAQADLAWPADRFYWAVIQAPGVAARRPGPIPPGLLSDLADEVPLPVNEIHAVAVFTGGQLLVCAAPRRELELIPPGTRSLRPACPPAGVNVDPDVVASLNLLVGEFEPPAQRRRRALGHLLGVATATLLTGLILTGLVRRANHWDHVAQRAHEGTRAMLDEVLPSGPSSVPPVPGAIAAEIARLRQAADASQRVRAAPDAALALAALLRAWPAAEPCRPQSLTITETGITVSVLIEGEYGPFLRAFVPPPGWALQEPRVNATGEVARVVIDLKPATLVNRGGS